jgi:hypothetical protein
MVHHGLGVEYGSLLCEDPLQGLEVCVIEELDSRVEFAASWRSLGD